MDTLTSLVNIKKGDELTNSQIVEIFKCGNQGGMRKSNTHNCLLLITDHTKSLYDDRVDSEGVLHYTGMGKKGDQTLSYQNKTLYESRTSGIKVFFFERYIEGPLYTFIGEVELIDEPYQEEQFDEDLMPRQVYVFPLRLVDGENFPLISSDKLNEINESRWKKIRNLFKVRVVLIKLATRPKPAVSKQYKKVIYKQYDRDEAVKEYARIRANGVCQLCEEPAPFAVNKVPFLEVHHIQWLANGGPDTVDNVVALCPNCHRKMHMVRNAEDINKLISKAQIKLTVN